MLKRIITTAKTVNKFGLIVVLLASGAAVAKTHHLKQARQDTQNYYNSGTKANPVWHLNTRTEGDDSGQFSCSTDDNWCTANFTSTPTTGQQPTDYETGIYSVNP